MPWGRRRWTWCARATRMAGWHASSTAAVVRRRRPTRSTSAAILACLGSKEGHARVLRALTSPDDDEVEIAQVYLRHWPIADVNELRSVTMGIARMNGSYAQVRALDTLASLRLSDRQSLDELTRLFPVAKSVNVQRAIAGILIRADYQALRQVRAGAGAAPASPQVAGRRRLDRRAHPAAEGVVAGRGRTGLRGRVVPPGFLAIRRARCREPRGSPDGRQQPRRRATNRRCALATLALPVGF